MVVREIVKSKDNLRVEEIIWYILLFDFIIYYKVRVVIK